jgi:hypothetical protein
MSTTPNPTPTRRVTNPAGPGPNVPRTGRMGLQAYARVLALVWHQPLTHEDVAEQIKRSASSLREILWRMEQLGLVRVVQWQQPRKVRGILTAAFQACQPGDPASAPYPRALNKPTPGSTLALTKPRPELISFANILRTLRLGATRDELREVTGVAHHRLSALLRELRTLGIAHRSTWAPRNKGGAPAEVLQLGPGRDAARPRRQTYEERSARYRLKRRTREAARRVNAALAGTAPVPFLGVQSYHLLGGQA